MARFRVFSWPVLIALLFFAVNAGLQNWVYPGSSYNHQLLRSHLTQQIFWFSSTGISLKGLIDMLIASVLIFAAGIIMDKRMPHSVIIKSVALAYLVFLLQMIIEAIIIKNEWFGVSTNSMQTFSFLSVSFFLQIFGSKPPSELQYASQNLSVFEGLFTAFITFFLHIKSKVAIRYCMAMAVAGYLFPLLLWLFFISTIILLNAGQ